MLIITPATLVISLRRGSPMCVDKIALKYKILRSAPMCVEKTARSNINIMCV